VFYHAFQKLHISYCCSSGDEANKEDEESDHHSSVKTEQSKPKDLKQQEKDRLKETVMNGRVSALNSIIYDFVESKSFTGFIMSIILINTGILMAQTYTVVNVRVCKYL
jgi:hypothetical protein